MTFRLTRRRFLFLGVTAGVAAVLGGVAVWPDPAALEDDSASYRVLTAHDRAILAALAPAMLAGAWPITPETATTETQALPRGLDTTLRGLPPRARAEMRQLLDLLGRQGGRVALAGSWVGWATVDPARAAVVLAGWRDHALALLQQAYGGLHDLLFGVWYGDPRHWADCGYPGPPTLRLTAINLVKSIFFQSLMMIKQLPIRTFPSWYFPIFSDATRILQKKWFFEGSCGVKRN